MDGDIEALQKRIAEWANVQFPNRSVFSALAKLTLEEIPEFLAEPDSPEEYADLLILILDIAYLQGINIKQAVIGKMLKNESASWEVDNNGIMHRIKRRQNG